MTGLINFTFFPLKKPLEEVTSCLFIKINLLLLRSEREPFTVRYYEWTLRADQIFLSRGMKSGMKSFSC